MKTLALARTHTKIAGRQKALWFTVIPLAGLATLLALTSAARPGTGDVEDLAFAAKMIAIFSGIAYAAAFAGFFTTASSLGMQELEASSPVSPLALRSARVIGAFTVVITPAAIVLLAMGVAQTLNGYPWSIPAALAVLVTIVAPAALIAMSISGVAGALLPRAFGRIVAALLWFYLVFSTPLIPLPTINGTPFNVIGDTIGAGYFHTSPLYLPSGPLGTEGTLLTATLSLAWQLVLVLILLALGTWLAGRAQKR